MDSRTDDKTPEPQRPEAEPPPAERAPRARRQGSAGVAVALVASLAAAGFAGMSWYETHGRIGATQEEVARRLRDFEGDARDARAAARQAQESLGEQQAKIAQLDARLTESQVEQVALETLYQELARNRDEWQLAEIEQVLAIASQQLQLSGNVRAALLALQLAESRLARSDRPQFLPVRRALARDIDRLKALPALDIAGMSFRLDRLAAGVDRLPLGAERLGTRVAGARAGADEAREGFWARLGAEIWGELKQLVVVHRTDGAAPPLIAPAQAYFLRENLRLRLLNARLSLLMRDESGYREQLRTAQAWLGQYFDVRAKPTADALAQLKELAASPLGLEMPTIAESLEAVRAFKSRRERGS